MRILGPGWIRATGNAFVPAPRAGLARLSLVQEIGGWVLAALALALPFELTQRPLLQTHWLVLTDLKLLFYGAAAISALALAVAYRRLLAGVPAADTDYLRSLRWVLLALAALLLASLLSTAAAADRLNAVKWTADLIPGGLVALALPLFFLGGLRRHLGRAAVAFLTGASIAALVGIIEVVLGSEFDRHLLWFKVGPTLVGPYLRLSGTFEYANIAGAYFALALPAALAGAAWCLTGRRVRWLQGLAAGFCLFLFAVALVLTSSRGALLGAAIGTLSMGLAVRNRRGIRESLHRYHARAALFAAGVAAVVALGAGIAPGLGSRLTGQGDTAWYRVAIHPGRVPAMSPGAVRHIPVTVANLSPSDWRSSGNRRSALSYHWLTPAGRVAEFEGVRSFLPPVVPAGSAVTVQAEVRAPSEPGRYVLAWDVVENTLTWFGMRSGVFVKTPVAISGPAAPPALRYRAAPGEPAVLPEAVPQPDRRVLWAAALRMVQTHPLVGVGPDGYRLSYGRYARPRQTRWDRRIFANSLPLELLADLGLLGTLSFAALLGVIVSPVVRLTWRGTSGLWEAALAGTVAAFLAHGMLDYLLGDHAILIAFWLMLGLCLTVRALQSRERATCA